MSQEDVRVSNEESSGLGGAFADLLRLQTEFQARLAEETLRYLRRLQGAGAPAAPGTVLSPAAGVVLEASGAAGSTVVLRLEIENRQRVHCVVTPLLAPLVDAAGTTWFPAAEPSPGSTLLAPGQARALEVAVTVPPELQPGTYRGALLLQGFRDGGVPVAIEVAAPAAPRRPRSSGTRRRAGGAK